MADKEIARFASELGGSVIVLADTVTGLVTGFVTPAGTVSLASLGGGGGGSFASISGSPTDNAGLAAALTAIAAAAIAVTQKGAANGVAALDGTGKVPTGQLPTLTGTASTQTPNALASTPAVGTSTAFMRGDAVLPLPSINAVGGLPQSSGNYNAATNTVLTGPYAGQNLVSGTLPTGTSTAPTCFTVTVPGTPGVDGLVLSPHDQVFYSSALVWDVMGGAAQTTGMYGGDGTTSGRLVVKTLGLDYGPAPIFQTGTSLGVMPNCTIGAAGVITFGTTTPTAFPQGCWMWYSANALFSGSAAGWWWTVLVGSLGFPATAGTVYNSYLASTGTTAQQSGLTAGATLANGWTAGSTASTSGITGGTHTQPTATNIYPPGPNIPANYIGNNGCGEAKFFLRNNNTANIKSFTPGTLWPASNPTAQTLNPVTSTFFNSGSPGHQGGATADFTVGSASYGTHDTTLAIASNPIFNFAAGGAGNDWQVVEYLRITITPRA